MTMVLLGSLTGTLLGWLMGFLSVFLILLILIQRGKGGGLTGALGGPGGQSAFGSKAGDTFTVITIVVASLWGFTCAMAMLILGTDTLSPTIASETRVTAGPRDRAPDSDSLIIPPRGDFGAEQGFGLGEGLGAPSTEQPPAAPGETPSMDLTPPSSADPAAVPEAEAPQDEATPAAETPQEPAEGGEETTPTESPDAAAAETDEN